MHLDFDVLFSAQGMLYLIMLSLLEIVLGIDNIIFISIITDKLPALEQKKARNTGLFLALIIRLFLLTIVGLIMGMTEPLFTVYGVEMTGQKMVLLGGGLFLIYKSTVEMHKNISGEEEVHEVKKGGLAKVILQIVLIDIVFSFDSIITAIGMTNGIAKDTGGNPIIIIYSAVIVSMAVMMLFAKPISDFINTRPTIKMLALAFLVTIGAILVAEAFGQEIPKGYIYFAMVYAMSVEFLNIRMRRKAGKEE